jgi:hypothetical protein
LVVIIERITFQVFVGSVPDGNSGPGQNILDSPAKARLLLLYSLQSIFDRL